MPPEESLLLIVAITGRALAQSARRGGYRPVVLDCFADADTRIAAEALHQVAEPATFRFSEERLRDAARDVGPAPLVYGAGFEGRDRLLARLTQNRPLFGNPADVMGTVRDPRQFFAALDELRIPHPEVAYDPPGERDGWLVKEGGSGGGVQVRLAEAWRPDPAAYFQRLSPGIPMSALFLANGTDALVLGFNEQWTAPQPGLPFVYGGAVSRIDLPVVAVNALTRAVNDLTAHFGLRGLNGLDFLWHQGDWSVLELNPRPTATVELYDPDYPTGLVDAH
ncbi:MAG TPA: ATP-grasp domain-containing protein, partial [Gemmatimonadales bacterium]|nr:ATP-grasp domain-containing protein [Gemmatimonadales bacterium]